LINKGGGDQEITEQDLVELRALLPALGEIIRTADESMEISRLSYGKILQRISYFYSSSNMSWKYKLSSI